MKSKLLRVLAIGLLLSILIGHTGLQAARAAGRTSIEPLTRAQGEDVPRFEAGDCPEEVQGRIPPGDEAHCGVLVVPERYENPEGATIELDVMIIPGVTNSRAPDPIVFAQGGPGGSTIDYYSQVLFTSRIRANRDFILFDQRGTLYSQPALFCDEIYAETIRTLPLDLSVEESEKLFRDAALACRARLIAEGTDLSAYNSVENARDIDSLRKALGYAKINLYGVSYGTLLALHTMREAPLALRSVILDAVVPTTVDFNFDAPNSQDRAFSEFFQACKQDASCDAEYPNLEQFFFDLVARMNDRPIHLTLTDDETGESYAAVMDGDTLVSALFQMLYITEFLPLLPKMIHNVAEGHTAFLERIYALLTFDRTMSYGMYFSVVCAEDGTVDPGYSYEGIREQFSKDVEVQNESLVQLCNAWSVEQLGARADEPVTSDIPTLVFNGRFDPITPPAYGQEAAKTLSRSFVYVFPNTGHGALISSECADTIFLEFLSNPEREPDSSCIDATPPLRFLTDRDVIDLPLMLQLASLQGSIVWQAALFGLGILGMLSSGIVFPLAWLLRRVRSRPARPGPGLSYLASWLPFMNAGVLIALAGGLFAVVILLVTSEETAALYFGLPVRYGALLGLGFFSLLLTLGILAYAAAGWIGRYWTLWRRVYFTFLAISALLTAVMMGIWGLFTFFM